MSYLVIVDYLTNRILERIKGGLLTDDPLDSFHACKSGKTAIIAFGFPVYSVPEDTQWPAASHPLELKPRTC